MKRTRSLALLLPLLWPAAAAADAPPAPAEIAGVPFAARIVSGGTPLALHGLGTLRRFLLTGYAAALYLGSGVPAERVLEDVPKRLELHYFYRIDGEKFGATADEILRRHFDEPTLAPLRERINRIAALYEDVAPGDRYSLTYVPGRGTELARNGVVKGVIPGADFAAVYFSIWLGDDPMDEALRTQLLRPRS